MEILIVFFLLEVASGSTEKAQKCPDNDFYCANGRCILSSWKCDQRNDCGDNSDELGCPTDTLCTSQQMACTDGECIAKIWRCDGEQDCVDGSDEEACDSTTCDAKTQLRCGHGQCVPISWICDGTHDCLDGTDERNCTRNPCGNGKFQCKDGLCIDQKRVCDSRNDCTDGEDEKNCSMQTCTNNNGGCAQQCQTTPQGSKCSCHEGYVLSKDGFTCEDAYECNPPGSCSHFCNNTNAGLKCSCAEGYVLGTDQRTCKATGKEAYLAYLMADGIRGLGPLSSTYYTIKDYISRDFESVIAIDYDTKERIFFWADKKEKTINSFPMNSSGPEVSFKTEHEPVFLRRDWLTQNFFYTTTEGSIACCNAYGSYCTSVIANVSSQINGLSISPKFAFIFWAASKIQDRNISSAGSGFIERANMDGSFRKVIVSEHIVSPTSITVDPVLETIYWCDLTLGVIESTDFNGLRRRKIVEHLQYPTNLVVFEDSIYWSDKGTHYLRRCNKFICNRLLQLEREASQIKCLAIDHEAAQMKGKNRCSDNNCLHVCLPTRDSFVCKCDDRYSSDATNCERVTPPGNQSCPENYCSQNAECVIEGDQYVCRCRLQFTGDRCEVNTGDNNNSSNEMNPVLFVCPVLIVICVCLLATLIFYRRYRRKSNDVFSSVQFVTTDSCAPADLSGKQGNGYRTDMIM